MHNPSEENLPSVKTQLPKIHTQMKALRRLLAKIEQSSGNAGTSSPAVLLELKEANATLDKIWRRLRFPEDSTFQPLRPSSTQASVLDIENLPFGKRLRFVRQRLELTLTEFSGRFECGGTSTVNNWERGAYYPRFEKILGIAKAAEVAQVDLKLHPYFTVVILALREGLSAVAIIQFLLQEVHQRLNLNMSSIARELNTSPSTISNWSCGNNAPTIYKVEQLLKLISEKGFEIQFHQGKLSLVEKKAG